MFYAELTRYGINTISSDDTLMRFETCDERDEMVERINGAHGDLVCQALTYREARHLYRVEDFGTGRELEVNGARTNAGRSFFEVGSRKGGPLR